MIKKTTDFQFLQVSKLGLAKKGPVRYGQMKNKQNLENNDLSIT